MPSLLHRAWYQIVRSSTRAALTFGFSLCSEGNERVPETGPCLLLANHQSYLDPPAVGATVRRELYFLARKTLWRNSLFGSLLTSINCIPVDQEGVATSALKAMLTLLEAGAGLVVFPEGTRSVDGNMNPLKPGILLLMKKLDFPIVPVGMAGFYETWPLHKKWPTFSPLFVPPGPRGTLAVSYGKPVPSSAYKGMDRDAVLNDLYRRIFEQRARAEQIRRKPVD